MICLWYIRAHSTRDLVAVFPDRLSAESAVKDMQSASDDGLILYDGKVLDTDRFDITDAPIFSGSKVVDASTSMNDTTFQGQLIADELLSSYRSIAEATTIVPSLFNDLTQRYGGDAQKAGPVWAKGVEIFDKMVSGSSVR